MSAGDRISENPWHKVIAYAIGVDDTDALENSKGIIRKTTRRISCMARMMNEQESQSAVLAVPTVRPVIGASLDLS